MTAIIKKLFSICIPVCICSFILFGITVAMFGRSSSTTTTQIADVVSGSYDGYGWEAFTTVDGVSSWTLRGDYTNIDVEVGSGSVELLPAGDGENLTYVEYSGGKIDEVECYIGGGCLTINLSGKDVSYFWEELGDAISSGDFSKLADSRKLTVRVPSNVYEGLYTDLGSGSLKINGVSADSNTFNVGSGAFYYTGAENFTAQQLYLEMGSGYTEIRNVPTKEYNISVGSGSFKIGDLSGNGYFEMGSGSGTLNFSEIADNNTIDVNSGSLNVEIPQDTNAQFMAEIGSGSIRLDACGQKLNLHDDFAEGIGFGSGENGLIYVDLGSGSVSITNNDFTSEAVVSVVEDAQLPSTTIPHEKVADEVASAVESAVEIAAEAVSSALGSAVDGITITPEPPEVPAAPTAPEAPEPPRAA